MVPVLVKALLLVPCMPKALSPIEIAPLLITVLPVARSIALMFEGTVIEAPD